VKEYYARRVAEYDATSWEAFDERRSSGRVRSGHVFRSDPIQRLVEGSSDVY
jgi:hypothetical protein